MAGVAIITEACIGVKDRACVDVCPVQCIYEFDPTANALVSEHQAGSVASRRRELRRFVAALFAVSNGWTRD